MKALVHYFLTAALLGSGVAHAGATGQAKGGARDVPAPAAPAQPLNPAKPVSFTPPPADSIPNDDFGKIVKKGEQIFVHTQDNARQYVGNSLNCVNCHLDAGRKAGAGPLWAAWPAYPAYRSKNKRVNTFAERLQGCFQFSMNGNAPPAGDEVLVALESYAYWLSTGAPVRQAVEGRGYPKLAKPAAAPDYARGQKLYAQHCALCHGAGGEGQASSGKTVFPPLWGPKSFNWGAGMHDVGNAAAFIRANMPLGLGGTLSEQEAWDVAMFMDSHERPQDPRFTGSVAETRKKYHDEPTSMYGLTVNGHVLGGR
jgi:thiosulfate dehydrogenase